jgi:predicted RNA-binding protein
MKGELGDIMEKSYFIFVANDISLLDKKISVVDIKDILLTNSFWAFTGTAPLRSKLKMGDEVLIYLAGQGRREFVAAVTIANSSEPILKGSIEEEIVLSNLGIVFLKYKISLKNVHFLHNSVKISPHLKELRFIRDKKNYGLHLRLPIVRICSEDFELILSYALDKEKKST